MYYINLRLSIIKNVLIISIFQNFFINSNISIFQILSIVPIINIFHNPSLVSINLFVTNLMLVFFFCLLKFIFIFFKIPFILFTIYYFIFYLTLKSIVCGFFCHLYPIFVILI